MNTVLSELTMNNTSLKETKAKLPKVKDIKTPYDLIKRTCDIGLSSIGIIVLAPIFLLIGTAIKIDSKGPAFFVHKRIGKNGKMINIYKFRTMYEGSEDMIAKFSKEQLEEYNKNYKLKEDPRVTKIGKFLRKTSLDELPQILNILKGELSIVGPRPVVSNELEKYGKDKDKFLSIKPGLTGYWQVNGRSLTSYEDRMKMELYYVENRGIWLDTKVFLKTILSVIKKEGAI